MIQLLYTTPILLADGAALAGCAVIDWKRGREGSCLRRAGVIGLAVTVRYWRPALRVLLWTAMLGLDIALIVTGNLYIALLATIAVNRLARGR